MQKIYTFAYTGDIQTFEVPSNAVSIVIQAYGAQGSSSGGYGGYATGTYTFKTTDSKTIKLYVGGTDGFNGGQGSRSGGGATDVRINGTALANRIIVAGGGGAAGSTGAGGAGGGLTGSSAGSYGSTYGSASIATGGTQVGGGIGSTGYNSYGNYTGKGGSGALGMGGLATNAYAGGGGAGYYGGGSGQIADASLNRASGGAGGSSYIALLIGGTTTAGQKAGNGSIIITLIFLDKYLLEQGGNYYSIASVYYDALNQGYTPLALIGDTTPNQADINSFGFDDLALLTTPLTVGTETFLPIDKFKKEDTNVIYCRYVISS